MSDDLTDFPAASDASLVRRLASLPSDAHRWVGNGARIQADHHQLVSAGSGPFNLRLEWSDARGSSTTHVGDYRIDLRALASRGYLQEKGKAVRLRFVRRSNGVVVIQANDCSPWLAIGWARFGAWRQRPARFRPRYHRSPFRGANQVSPHCQFRL